MITIESALKLFKGSDTITKQEEDSDDEWKNIIGPSLDLLGSQGYATILRAAQVDYPIHGELTPSGKHQRDNPTPKKKVVLLTAEIKDLILKHLIESYELGQFAAIEIKKPIYGFSSDQLDSVLQHFGDIDLIDYTGHVTTDRTYVHLVVKVKAHDFIQQGGFYGIYDLFQKNVEKLLWEVEKLEHSDENKNNKFSKIKDNIKEYIGYIATTTAIGESTKNIFE